jgi:fucose 4-O-acetylase-like acetyltransferase
MPLFFMISGVLLESMLARKGYLGYIKNRFNTIFYPLLVWGILRITLQLAVGHLSPKQANADLYLSLLTDPRKIAPFWYLHALFCVSVLYTIIKVKLKLPSLYNLVLGALLYLASAYISTRGVHAGFAADIVKYYVFFAMGDVLSDIILSEKTRNLLYSTQVFFVLLIPFLVVQAIVMKYNVAHRDIQYVENAIPILYLIQGIVGCAFSIAVSFLLQKWNTLPGLKAIGIHSLYIYCMHYLVIIVCCVLCIKGLHIHNTLLLVAICWTAAVAVPIVIYKLSTRFGFWWLFSLSKPKNIKVKAEVETSKEGPHIISGTISA